MCGGCRVTIGGETRYACVDGPEFDGHQVDFGELADRLTTYRSFEQAALAKREACKIPRSPSTRTGSPRKRNDDRRGEDATASRRGETGSALRRRDRQADPRRRARGAGSAPADEHRTGGDARRGCGGAVALLRGGQPRPDRTPRGPRGRALSPVQEPQVHRRLPGPRQHPQVHRPPATRRHGRCGRFAPGRQRTALRDRTCLPPGDAVRGPLPPGEEGHERRDRLAGAVRRRLGAGASRGPHPGPADRPRPDGRRRRVRAGRPDRRGRTGQEGLRRHDLRGVPRGGRRAHLRHPAVPPPERHRRKGSRSIA